MSAKETQKPTTAKVVEVQATTLEKSVDGLTYDKLKNSALAIQGLQTKTNRLDKQMQSMMLEVAFRLGEIKQGQWYLKDGFKSVQDFASSILGYKSNMVSKMVAASSRMLNHAKSDGAYDIHTKFAFIDALSHTVTDDFGLTQLFELAGVDESAISNALNSGEISFNSTCADLRKFAKALKGGSNDSTDSKQLAESSSASSDSNAVSNDGGVTTPVGANVVSGNTNADKPMSATTVSKALDSMEDKQILAIISSCLKELKKRGFKWNKRNAAFKNMCAVVDDVNKPNTSAKDAKSI